MTPEQQRIAMKCVYCGVEFLDANHHDMLDCISNLEKRIEELEAQLKVGNTPAPQAERACMTKDQDVLRPDWWACACVKRDHTGLLKKIKLHPPTTKRCNVCGCTKMKKP